MKFKSVLLVFVLLILATIPARSESNDLASQLDVSKVIGPGLYSSDQTSDAIDAANYRANLLGIYVSAGSYTTSLGMEFNLKHCATSNGTFTAVASSDMVGVTPSASGTVYTVNAEITTPAYHEVLYVGRMPYMKLTMDMFGNHATATPTVAIIDIKGRKIIAR